MIRRIAPGLLLVLASAAAGSVRPAAAQGAAREICVEPAGGPPGARVAVPLFVLEGGGVAAFQVDVRFDPFLLSYAALRAGPDTAAAGGWVFDSQRLGAGLVRVLGYTFPPAGLGPGLKRLAFLDFDVVASGAVEGVPLPLSACVLGDADAAPIPCGACVQPGAEAAAPRFAISLVDDGFAFLPARIVIEPGDWVLWKHAGLFRLHTTTSGANCAADGVWRGLLEAGGRFARRFPEPGGSVRPLFSEPDCPAGMAGEVELTDEIRLDLAPAPGGTILAWSGGGGRYRVHRSPAATFVAPGTEALAPDSGETGMTFTEVGEPGAGQAIFYLVANAP